MLNLFESINANRKNHEIFYFTLRKKAGLINSFFPNSVELGITCPTNVETYHIKLQGVPRKCWILEVNI